MFVCSYLYIYVLGTQICVCVFMCLCDLWNFIYTYGHVCIYGVHISIYVVCAHIYMFAHLCICIYIYIHMFVCKYVNMSIHFVEVFTNMCLCTCLYVGMHMFVFVCINAYTNAHIYIWCVERTCMQWYKCIHVFLQVLIL